MMEHIEYFCDSLIILVKGNTVLKGKLTKIKEDFRKKNVKVKADLNEEEIKKVNGVESIEKNKDEYTIKIEDSSYINTLFKAVSKYDNVTKFVVEEPTLNEIFISKKGIRYAANYSPLVKLVNANLFDVFQKHLVNWYNNIINNNIMNNYEVTYI